MSRVPNRCRWLVIPLVAVGILVVPLSPVASEDKPDGKPAVVVKRRIDTTEEELRKQLREIPEAGFDKPNLDAMYPFLKSVDPKKEATPPDDFGPRTFETNMIQANRPEMGFLPWIGGNNELPKDEADDLGKLATKIQLTLRLIERKSQSDLAPLRKLLTENEWKSPRAVPALTQILQGESTEIRLILVETLAAIRGGTASAALAKRALFDLSPNVREKAVLALVGRPAAEYTPTLISGFRYPWPAAADHAAEAVVALKLSDMVPELVNLLKEPDPALPVKTEGGYSVKEVVRLNHLCNCVLCHAPSLASSDRVRASVVPSNATPTRSYADRSGLAIRAELTHLRQDFSVLQPVANPGKWPGNQRYDYLVRTRPLSATEQTAFEKVQQQNKTLTTYPQQGSVLFALRELTGKDHGQTHEGWATALRTTENQPKVDR